MSLKKITSINKNIESFDFEFIKTNKMQYWSEIEYTIIINLLTVLLLKDI